MVIKIVCLCCEQTYFICANSDRYFEWDDESTIDDLLPSFTPSEFEFLKTGICEDCLKS